MSDQTNGKGKVYYGKIAEQFKGDLTADRIRNLLDPNRKKTIQEEKPRDKRPGVLQDPQGSIIQGRLRRFRPAVMYLAKNFTLRMISRDDFLIAIRNETRRLLTSMRGLGRLLMNPVHVEKTVRDVLDTLSKMLEGVQDKELDIQMAVPLTNTIVGIVETAINERSALPDHVKISEVFERKPVRGMTGSPLDRFPPHIRSALFSRLTAIGLNPHDMDNLKRLARTLGIDNPDEAIAELEKGNIPESLRGFF